MKRSVLTLTILIVGLCLLGFTAIIEAWSASGNLISLSQAPGPNTASINDVTVTEGDSGTINARFTVSLVRSVDFPVRFDFATADATATVTDNDYVARTGSVFFGFGTPIAQTIDIVVNGDTRIEGDEIFLVNLTRPPETDLGILDGQGVCTILNDDASCSYSISPTSQSFPPPGGTNSVALIAPARCAWTATSNVGWISITSGASGSGNGTVNYSVGLNTGATRTGTMTIADRVFTVTQTGDCEYSLSPMSQAFPIGGGSNAVSVATRPGCQWIALSNDSWITVTSGSDGTGAGLVRYSVAANTGIERTGTMTIAGQTFTVNQEGNCLYTVSFLVQSVPASGGDRSVEVTTRSGCAWTAVSNATFITILSGESGVGSGMVSYRVAPNQGPNRDGTLTIAGKTLTVAQAGEGCVYRVEISPFDGLFRSSGGDGALRVTTTFGCEWTAISDADWITLAAPCLPENCAGSGTVAFTVGPNGGRERRGTIRIAGQRFVVTQEDANCSYTIAPTSLTLDMSGGSGNIRVTAPANCPWQVSGKPPWVTITSQSYGSGNGSVRYLVAANPGEGRSGTITIEGQTFTLRQCGAFYPIFPSQSTFLSSGGNGVVEVRALDGCTWTATSQTAWIRVTGGAVGRGRGNVNYTVDANQGASRIGSLTIAGRTFSVAQANAGCVTALSETSIVVPAVSFNPYPLHVDAPAGCEWRAVSTTPWLTSDPIPGCGSSCSGAQDITYRVQNNEGAPRTGFLIIGGQILVVEQAGIGCDVSISPTIINVGAGGALTTVTVTADNLCSWEGVSHDSWITFPELVGASRKFGTGTETVQLRIGDNRGPWRTGAVTIGGQPVVVNQDSDYCPVEIICVFFPASCLPPTEELVGSSRAFRDNTLARSERGRQYTKLYYQFSREAVRRMMRDPSLVLRVAESFERYKPVIEEMAKGEPATLSSGDLQEIDTLLNAFAESGSDDFKLAVKSVCEDLRDPQVHREFQLNIIEGPRRELNAQTRVQHFKQLGIASSLLALFVFGISGRRRRFIKRNSTKIPLLVLATAGLTNCLAPIVNGHAPPVGNHFMSTSSPTSKRDQTSRAAESYGKLPLSFEANLGQADSQVKFLSRGDGFNLYLMPTEAVLRLPNAQQRLRKAWPQGLPVPFNPQSAIDNPQLNDPQTGIGDRSSASLHMKMVRANPSARITGIDELPAKSNYFIGNDQAEWRSGVRAYARVKYANIYQGVNLIYYGSNRQLEYDFTVAPGADYGPIALEFTGADGMILDSNGDLVMKTTGGELRQHRPIAYQEVNGSRREIICGYRLLEGDDSRITPQSATSNRGVGFYVGDYDRSLPLTIDPVLSYSTYLGGNGDDEGNTITVDSAGNAYIVGFTDSVNFPTSNASQASFGGAMDAFVTKLNPSGTGVVYSTYIGGTGQDNGTGIAVDAAGNAYVTGFTDSTNFPLANILQSKLRGLFNAFVLKLSPSGSQLAYSTYLGGTVSDFGSSIAVDSAGSAYVAGVTTSPSFPVMNPVQQAFAGIADAFIAKLNPSGSSLAYSTCLGGTGAEAITGIALDSSGNAYLSGITSSANFPVINGAQPSYGGGVFDAFVMKVNATGTALVYSSYLGGSGEDHAFRIAVDISGNAYVTGDTASTDFPITNPLQPALAGGFFDAFVTRLNQSGSVFVYSTYLGGSEKDAGTSISVDSAGSAYVTGFTDSANFPLANPLQATFGGTRDAFVTKLNATGPALDFSTYLGGSKSDLGFSIAVDSSGSVYVLGQTDSVDFPVASPYQRSYGGGPSDVFISKITALAQAGPRISGASIEGKNLIVTGSGFDAGARILVNGQSQKTSNNAQNPATSLIGKKTGRRIARGETVTLQVSNSNGASSPEFRYTRPPG